MKYVRVYQHIASRSQCTHQHAYGEQCAELQWLAVRSDLTSQDQPKSSNHSVPPQQSDAHNDLST